MAQETECNPMAEMTDEAIQAALADESTPKALRDWATSLQAELVTARTEASAVKREAAFAKAGLSDLPHKSLFERTYEGEMTPEAIKEAAKEYGLVPETPAANATVQDRADLDAIRRTQAASSGATTGANDGDLFDALDRAGSTADVMKLIRERGSEMGVSLPESAGGYTLV